MFKSQHGLANAREKDLLATQIEKRFRQTSEKNGGDPLSQIARQRVSSDRMLAFSEADFLQTLLNHPRREIGEMGWKIIQAILNAEKMEKILDGGGMGIPEQKEPSGF